MIIHVKCAIQDNGHFVIKLLVRWYYVQVTSQVPYLEQYIGPPHVYTIDYNDVDQLHRLLTNITNEVSVFQLLKQLH